MSRSGNKNLSIFLREVREYRGMSKRQLSDAAGLSPSYICRIESAARNPTRSTLHLICTALLLKPDDHKYQTIMELAGFGRKLDGPLNTCLEIETLKEVYSKSNLENQREIKSALKILIATMRFRIERVDTPPDLDREPARESLLMSRMLGMKYRTTRRSILNREDT